MTEGWLRWKCVMCFFGSGIQVSMQAVCSAYFQSQKLTAPQLQIVVCLFFSHLSFATHCSESRATEGGCAASWPLFSSDNLIVDCSVTWHRPGPACFSHSHCSGKLHCTISKRINFSTYCSHSCSNSDVPQCLVSCCFGYWKQPKVTHVHELFLECNFHCNLCFA